MSTYAKTLNQGENWILPGGASFQILLADKYVDVEFKLRGRLVNRATRVPASFYYRPDVRKLDDSGYAFDEVVIFANHGNVILDVDVSDSESGTNILSGDVTVSNMDTWEYDKTDKGREFHGYIALGAVSAQYSQAQLFNPAGSGKRLFVSSIETTALVDSSVYLLTGGTSGLGTLGMKGGNKIAGGESGKGEVRYTASASVQVGDSDFLARRFIKGYTSQQFVAESPIRLDEGVGLILYAGVNTGFNAMFEWSEV